MAVLGSPWRPLAILRSAPAIAGSRGGTGSVPPHINLLTTTITLIINPTTFLQLASRKKHNNNNNSRLVLLLLPKTQKPSLPSYILYNHPVPHLLHSPHLSYQDLCRYLDLIFFFLLLHFLLFSHSLSRSCNSRPQQRHT